MSKYIFIQTGDDSQILNQGCYTAYYAYRSLGIPVKLYENFNELITLSIFV